MPGLFDVRLRDAAVSCGKSGVVRRVRHGDSEITIDTDHEVGLVLNLSESLAITRRLDGRTSSARPKVGAVTLMPPGRPTAFRLVGAARVLMLRVPWSSVCAWCAEDHGLDSGCIELEPRLAFQDPVLARLLYAAAASPPEGGEGTLRAVAERIFFAHGSRPKPRANRHVGGLSPARLKRVNERIEAGLAAEMPLATLAAEAGMSVFHFAREFRRVTGSAPHEYVLQRRLARAIDLLGRGDLPVVTVAAETGFTHSSHLSRHMRRLTGLSPAVFRTEVLP